MADKAVVVIVKCNCEHCSVGIEFDPANFVEGMKVDCPECGLETQLFMPRRRQDFPPKRETQSNPRLTHCAACGHLVSKGAVSCPSCGQQFKNPGAVDMSDPVHVVGMLIVVGIIIGLVGMMIWAALSLSK